MGGGQDTDVKHDTVTAGKFTLPPPSARSLSLTQLPLRAVVLVGMWLIWLNSAVVGFSGCACCTCVYASEFILIYYLGFLLQVTFRIIRIKNVQNELLWSWQSYTFTRLRSKIHENTHFFFFLSVRSGRSDMINKIITSSI